MVFVAQRVEFRLVQNSTRDLNGLFEYDPTQDRVNETEFTNSAFIKLGSTFAPDSAVTSLITSDDMIYIGGNFTSDDVSNIAAVNGNDPAAVSLDGSLNGGVMAMVLLDNTLFVGGQFNNTLDGSAEGLNNVAAYDKAGNAWSPLGAGVNGIVKEIVPITLNVSGEEAEDVITLTGNFKQLLAFDGNDAVGVDGFAVWVPSQKNWLQNLDGQVPYLNGFLSASLLNLPDDGSFYAGSLSTQSLRASGLATMGDELNTFPIKIHSRATTDTASSGLSKREFINRTEPYYGVVTALFNDVEGVRNITILGGHFAAADTDGTTINNLAFIDHEDSDRVTGLGNGLSEDNVFQALAVQGDNLFAGGRVNGTVADSSVSGLISYNLAGKSYNTQPPPLSGGNVTVTSIEVRPESGDVYVGGSFESAGSLPCPGVCIFNTQTNQWNRPGFDLNGNVNCMLWTSDSKLVVGGQFDANDTTTYLMSYDAPSSTWEVYPDASALPGPVEAMTLANDDGSQLWVAGRDDTGEEYLMKFDGTSWVPAGLSFGPGTVISSLQMFTLTNNHNASDLVKENQILMLTGSIYLEDFGTASSVIFNGSAATPYALTSGTNNAVGSISRIFTQRKYVFPADGK